MLTDQLMGWDTLSGPEKPEFDVLSWYKSTSEDCFNYSTREYNVVHEKKLLKLHQVLCKVLKDLLK